MGVFGFELTTQCNFACIHCFVVDARGQDKLSYSSVAEMIPSLNENGFDSVFLTGGEPMRHPDFGRIYTALRSAGFIVSVFSNGSILSASHSDVFRRLRPHAMEVTLYGATDATYERVTGRRMAFTRVRRNLDKLVELNVPLVLKFHLLHETIPDLDAYVSIAEQLGDGAHVNAQIIPRLDGDVSPLAHRMSAREIAQVQHDYGFNFIPPEDYRHRCDAGSTMYMDATGVVHGCPVLVTSLDRGVDESPSDLQVLIREFAAMRSTLDGRVCRGWQDLEGASRTEDFIAQARTELEALRSEGGGV